MKAAVLYAKHQPLRVEEVDLDPPRQREVLVKMAASGVCHSDCQRNRRVVVGDADRGLAWRALTFLIYESTKFAGDLFKIS